MHFIYSCFICLPNIILYTMSFRKSREPLVVFYSEAVWISRGQILVTSESCPFVVYQCFVFVRSKTFCFFQAMQNIWLLLCFLVFCDRHTIPRPWSTCLPCSRGSTTPSVGRPPTSSETHLASLAVTGRIFVSKKYNPTSYRAGLVSSSSQTPEPLRS